jgi:hypothetical protein
MEHLRPSETLGSYEAILWSSYMRNVTEKIGEQCSSPIVTDCHIENR